MIPTDSNTNDTFRWFISRQFVDWSTLMKFLESILNTHTVLYQQKARKNKVRMELSWQHTITTQPKCESQKFDFAIASMFEQFP